MFKILVSASLSSFLFGLFGVSWDSVDQKIDSKYPRVNFISTEELRSNQQSEAPLLHVFDVRGSEEFAVSHLSGALNYSESSSIAGLFANKNTDILSSSINQQANIVSSKLLMSSTIYMMIRLEKLQSEDQPQSDEKRLLGLIS